MAAGRFGRPHGVAGEIRLDSMGGLPRGLKGYTVFFAGEGEAVSPVKISSWRVADKALLLLIEGAEDRDKAALFTGKSLYVKRSEMPPLKEGEYYYADVEGMSVIDDNSGGTLGLVEDIKPWGDYDMLFIRTGRKVWLLPVTGEFVKSMDIEGAIIRVVVPEGLGS